MAKNGYLTPAEVARAFGVTPKTITRWASADPPLLPSLVLPSGHRRFRKEDVDAAYLRFIMAEGNKK